MATNIEIYEALKPHVGDEGARLIAEAVPGAQELVTKADLNDAITGLRTEMHEGFSQLRLEMAGSRTELAELKAEMRGWMLKFFVPLWIGVYGTLGAIVVSIALGR